jgi:hypothetical protein
MAENEKKRRPGGVYRMIVKIAVAIMFGLGAFALSQTLAESTEGQTLLAVGTSVFVSGIAFVVQFLLDVEARIEALQDSMAKVEERYEHHSQEIARTTKEQFEKINDATQLFGAVEASALRIDRITQLVKIATTVAQRDDSLVSRFAQFEITRLSGYLKDLGQQAAVTYEGEDRDWLLGLTKAAVKTIDATSLTTTDAGGRSFMDGGLWTGDLGQKYLVAQQTAGRRDVKIRRIFIFDRPEFKDDKDLVNILRQHIAAGVEVRTLTPGQDHYSFTDFIVFDGELCYQTQPASPFGDSRPIIATTVLITAPDRVQARAAYFEELWNEATPYALPPVPAQRQSG